MLPRQEPTPLGTLIEKFGVAMAEKRNEANERIMAGFILRVTGRDLSSLTLEEQMGMHIIDWGDGRLELSWYGKTCRLISWELWLDMLVGGFDAPRFYGVA